MSLKDQLNTAFQERFGAAPELMVRAPGRVNLIGEHTDYNDGFVLPMAIDRWIWIALRRRDDDQVWLRSLDFDQEQRFGPSDVKAPDQNRGEGWIEYIKGTAWALADAGLALRGWEGVFAGDVPIGAGLSSSAAVEMATARAFAAVGSLNWDPVQMARLGQRAENRWVGVNCGIMDQMISAAGQKAKALLIDCRSLEYRAVPLPVSTAVAILDTGTRRGLVDSAYNERRRQCEAGAALFGAKALRDVSQNQFNERAEELDQVTRRRVRHVIGENDRTEAAATAMAAGDGVGLGALMDASHLSLRDDFAVSSPALDTMVEVAQAAEGCLGGPYDRGRFRRLRRRFGPGGSRRGLCRASGAGL